MTDNNSQYTFDELCQLVALPQRTVRFYIQKGLVPPPYGKNRGARYDQLHLERLLFIRRWQQAGLSLERIAELMHGEINDVPPVPPPRPGSVEVWSKLLISDGVELHIEPGRSGLSNADLRALCQAVIAAYSQITSTDTEGTS